MSRTRWIGRRALALAVVGGALVALVAATGGDALAGKGGGKPGGGGGGGGTSRIADADVSVLFQNKDGVVWKGDAAGNLEVALDWGAIRKNQTVNDWAVLDPRFGPAGTTKIVFMGKDARKPAPFDAAHGVYVADDFSGANARKIADTYNWSLCSPTWSNGVTALGTELIAYCDDTADRAGVIFLTAPDGTSYGALTDFPYRVTRVEWNPADSTQLLARHPGGNVYLLDLSYAGGTVSLAGSQLVATGVGVDDSPGFTADGSGVVFRADGDFWRYVIATEATVTITNTGGALTAYWDPEALSDGRIACVYSDALYVTDADGSNIHLLGDADNLYPRNIAGRR